MVKYDTSGCSSSVEHWAGGPGVAGPIPVTPTIIDREKNAILSVKHEISLVVCWIHNNFYST